MIKNIKNNIELSSFTVVFDGSTMNEKPGTFGSSHICEHLLCKGFNHLQNEYQRYGIVWNAYTSNTEVVFYMTGLDEYIIKYKYDFLNFILSYEPTEEEFNNEKKIILEEYKDAFNDQIQSHYLNLHRKLFNYYNPIGLRSDIENYTLQECKENLKLYFNKPTKIINISKNNKFEYDVDFKDNIKYEPLNLKKETNLHYIKSDDDLIVPENKIPLELFNDFKNKTSIINISPVIKEDFNVILFTCNMLGSGLNSPLYQEVREKSGLAYYIQCFNHSLNKSSSVIHILTETSNDNVDKVQEEIKKVLQNKEIYLTQERFNIIKDNFLVKFKKNEILKHNNITKYIEPENWNVENIINDITLDDVYNVIDKYFIWDNFYKSIYSEEF